MMRHWESIDPSEVVAELCAIDNNIKPPAALLAGFIRLLEHMEAGRRFVAHASQIAKRHGADFDAYTERIATLNGWRVPLMHDIGRGRFEKLEALPRIGLRADEHGARLLKDGLEHELRKYVSRLKESWEVAQLSGFLTAD